MGNISFKGNGRTVPANSFADELTKRVNKCATDMLKQLIQAICCPAHYRAVCIGSVNAVALSL